MRLTQFKVYVFTHWWRPNCKSNDLSEIPCVTVLSHSREPGEVLREDAKPVDIDAGEDDVESDYQEFLESLGIIGSMMEVLCFGQGSGEESHDGVSGHDISIRLFPR